MNDDRLEQALRDVGREHEPDPRWQDKVRAKLGIRWHDRAWAFVREAVLYAVAALVGGAIGAYIMLRCGGGR